MDHAKDEDKEFSQRIDCYTSAHKDCDTNNFEKILAQYVDSKGICKECSHSHRTSHKFDHVRTSIDTFSELLQAREITWCAVTQ